MRGQLQVKGETQREITMTAKRANRKPTGECRKANGPRDNKPGKSRKEKGKTTYFHTGVD
jgi:hypothetical protein